MPDVVILQKDVREALSWLYACVLPPDRNAKEFDARLDIVKAELVRLARCQSVDAGLTRGQIADLLTLCTREMRGINELYERMLGVAKG